MEECMLDKILDEISEKEIVQEITQLLETSDLLLDGFGHDSAFIDITIGEDDILLMNTDRSGINIAYTLGLTDGNAECVGDFGVSHAVSDIVASGGKPLAITIALLLPGSLKFNFVKQVMIGAQKAAKKYGAFLAAGDTKKNSTFAMVVTVAGKAQKTERLTRSKAKKGDLLIVTGHLGTMLSGRFAFKKNICISKETEKILKHALIYQNPPYELGLKLARAKVANACTDISDGLASSIYNLCNASGVGAIIDETKIPLHSASLDIANKLNIRPMQLTLTGGDWQYLYSIPKENIDIAHQIAQECNYNITIIGQIIEERHVIAKTLEQDYKILKRIENDRFSNPSGYSFFDTLGSKIELFGENVELYCLKDHE
ncbi:thiamine-monophosphate kinase [Thiothrix litoralis]|uniref:Thiamine-monophosphate kinase n=1 Tax=Thiothrix litoralis TaxID=2891210 RepID=A0ABX7WTG5_9GAMM|nr:thiamine-phosphate kinase [Thiothrix litoralis]QTR46307.1 thiamine-monophosphate kinase [Thiothrix litoralis]